MSDNLRRYRAIREALPQGYQGELHGRDVQRLTTLAALISGIVGGKSAQLPHIATKVPDGTKPESRGKRFTRWLDNDGILAGNRSGCQNITLVITSADGVPCAHGHAPLITTGTLGTDSA